MTKSIPRMMFNPRLTIFENTGSFHLRIWTHRIYIQCMAGRLSRTVKKCPNYAKLTENFKFLYNLYAVKDEKNFLLGIIDEGKKFSNFNLNRKCGEKF
jgi:hypothetical protein